MQVCTSILGCAMPGQEFKQTRTWVDEQIMLYVNYVGACERIYKTPIPIAFTVSFVQLFCQILQSKTMDSSSM